MSPSRLRGALLGGTALLAGLVFLAWSQPWFTLTLVASSGDPAPLEVRGDVAASALAPLALTVLAIVAALALAGPVLRTVFGVLEALVGASVVAVTIVSLGDPVQASASAVTDVTGVAGSDSVAGLVSGVAVSVWPGTAIVFGILIAITGAFVAVTARRWPVSGRKYSRTRIEPAESAASDPVAEWDALSEGDDPTAPSR
ncbi:Trp biosynthesis-associated membrane protein [Protaetiibacter sp. SSC-01]|uniref:Trp biosynthesis-associated membrane protein n=1 Tax=Protaetiibacter sp. SSC-01 TaxID=2759943 RepID=UPI0016574DBE|nr:Trp biosynthesis-associated membrane protein [Protaetiibacter sp. SSC-01]QNO36366.1 Trp biosynthesis-associated membrane protein [Protaetiibacter sp. SSC-01]